MSYETDPRTGHPDSGQAEIVAGDGNTPQTAKDVPGDGLFRLEGVKIEYDPSATATTEVILFDEPDGTAAADVSDRRDNYVSIDPGEEVFADDLSMRDFEQGVLAQTDGNQDGPVDVTVYGTVLRALKDVVQQR